ncbi:MAG TPA: RNA polymerase sigma factor [Polyangiaceae bacterium]|nr:RNA polymerase sigma factor [Polyangiaceae bacterium]
MSAVVARPRAVHSSPLRALLAAELPRLELRARRLAMSPADAEDLVQDTIERALCFEPSFVLGTNLRAWLLSILQSVFVTRYRRRRRERTALARVASDVGVDLLPQPLFVPLPLSRATRAALQSLPPAFQEVIDLVDLHEHSYKEAALVLGVPVGTVMSRLFRARRLLAARLEPGEQPELPRAA